MDSDNRVLAIELAGEHRPNLACLQIAIELLDALLEIPGDILALLGPVDQHREIVDVAAKPRRQRFVVFDAAAALEDLLRARLVLPEIRLRRLVLDLRQLALQASFVKAPSAARWRERRDRRIGGLVHRASWCGMPFIVYLRAHWRALRRDKAPRTQREAQPDDDVAGVAVDRTSIQQADVNRQRHRLE
jgi:hypothetical protein